MKDYRQLILTFVIAILFSVFVFSLVEAVYPQPDYIDCEGPRLAKFEQNLSDAQFQAQQDEYASCYESYQLDRENYEFVRFLISIIIGVIAILVGMYVGISTPVGMAVASGLLLGGLFTIFFGTMSGWSSIGRILRPLVILIELVIVIWVAYKKLNNPSKGSKKK